MSDLETALTTAVRFHSAGRLDEAETIYRNILNAYPNHVQCLHLAGVASAQRGRHETALNLIGRAIALSIQNPSAPFHNNIGMSFRALGRLDEAAEHFLKAVAIRRDYPEAHSNLGVVYRERGEFELARKHYAAALSIKPNDAETHNNLGNLLKETGDLDGAERHIRRAIAIKPDYADAQLNLGGVFKDQYRLEEAAEQCRRAVAMMPGRPDTYTNLGNVQREMGQLDDALASCRKARAIAPDFVEAHWSEALLNLLRGDFDAGWRGYEWRWRRPETPPRSFTAPMWEGEDLNGRTILLHAEQGHGDTFQFARYVAAVKQRGAQIILECPSALTRLLRDLPGVDRLIVHGDELPAFDCHAALMSLPRLLKLPEPSPDSVPYLKAEPALVEAWRNRLPSGLKVGIVWRGNPDHRNDRKRSVAPARFAEICTDPAIRWIAMQPDATFPEIEALSRHVAIQDFGHDLADWAETAALISALDLVIAVDTAVAHLAGALGKPVWMLVPFDPDWRWQWKREDSPWYPTMQLFRQPTPGDWEGAFAQVREQLKALPR